MAKPTTAKKAVKKAAKKSGEPRRNQAIEQKKLDDEHEKKLDEIKAQDEEYKKKYKAAQEGCMTASPLGGTWDESAQTHYERGVKHGYEKAIYNNPVIELSIRYKELKIAANDLQQQIRNKERQLELLKLESSLIEGRLKDINAQLYKAQSDLTQ